MTVTADRPTAVAVEQLDATAVRADVATALDAAESAWRAAASQYDYTADRAYEYDHGFYNVVRANYIGLLALAFGAPTAEAIYDEGSDNGEGWRWNVRVVAERRQMDALDTYSYECRDCGSWVTFDIHSDVHVCPHFAPRTGNPTTAALRTEPWVSR